MEPRIQYAQTEDGVSIAFWTMGSGLPFVEMPSPPWSHVQLELQVPLWRAWDERLSENRTHVRYDHRGTGLSARTVTNVSLQTLVFDLEAVVNRLALEKFVLFGHHNTGAAAIAYAAKYPERVSQLILWCSYPRTGVDSRAQTRALRALLREDWETYTETLAHTVFGWSQGEEAHRFAGVMRECCTPEIAHAYYAAEFDVTDVLPDVKCPTLVVQRRAYQLVPVESAQELCSKIPNAELAILEGKAGITYMEDMEVLAAVIDEFLSEGEEEALPQPAPSGLFTILFTDVEGSTALTERLGDAKARELLREHERMVREALKAHGGAEVKTLGDGFMTSFGSATRALECAIAMQRAFAERNDSAAEPILVRIGLNAGEPIAEDDDLFGTAVNEAARITATAKGGEILVSDVVRQLVKGKDFLFSDVGERQLKGLDEPVRLYEVRWREESA